MPGRLLDLPPLMRGLFLAIAGVTILGMFLPFSLPGLLAMPSSSGPSGRALPTLELWRLVTYPFVLQASWYRIFSVIFTLGWLYLLLSYFGAELETIIHARPLVIGMTASVVLGALLFALTSHGMLAGPGILVMYVVTAFAYLWPEREISVFGLFWVKAWIMAIVILVVMILSPFDSTVTTRGAGIDALTGPLFGAIGALIATHLQFKQHSLRVFVPGRAGTRRGSGVDVTDPSDSERIDQILDKINRSGIKSLTADELAFLKNHSH